MAKDPDKGKRNGGLPKDLKSAGLGDSRKKFPLNSYSQQEVQTPVGAWQSCTAASSAQVLNVPHYQHLELEASGRTSIRQLVS